jgi:hypothetical protein
MMDISCPHLDLRSVPVASVVTSTTSTAAVGHGAAARSQKSLRRTRMLLGALQGLARRPGGEERRGGRGPGVIRVLVGSVPPYNREPIRVGSGR